MSDSTLIRLRHHAKDERNTTFARATMRDAEQEIERLRAELAHYKEAATKLSAETYDLEAELTASREREARMRAKLEYALRQNDLDMLLTGDEIRDCRAALAEGAQG